MDLARYQHLKLERQPGGVLLVTLDRPEVLNRGLTARESRRSSTRMPTLLPTHKERS